MWVSTAKSRYLCCGKLICKKCDSQGGVVLDTCPLCRGKAPESDDEMLSIYNEKAGSGIAWAQAEMGKYYLYGLRGMPKDMEKALSLLREAAGNGSIEAKTSLGTHFYGIENYEEARQWFEAAAARGK